MPESQVKCKARVSDIGTTEDCLADRAGLILFSRYINSIGGLFGLLVKLFSKLRKSKKGLPIAVLFKQLFCFFMDGSSLHLTRFDELAKDEGYAASIETSVSQMASSHQIKRFFQGFSFVLNPLFRQVLDWFFFWRLYVEQPAVIILDLDTMVMNNNDADAREGVQPTYKKVKGFQPLQMAWGRYLVSVNFRGGKKHSNYGESVLKEVRRVVRMIRRNYDAEVPIVLRLDGGFLDEVNFEAFQELRIGFICGGKLYDYLGEYVTKCPEAMWKRYRNGDQEWEILPFANKCKKWSRYYRALFCRPLSVEGQCLFEFARPDTMLYTNLGMGGPVDRVLRQRGAAKWLEDVGILELYHGRGADELVHRAFKDFGTEQLPFKRFQANAAFYYTMVVAFDLFEAFKVDVTDRVLPKESYATTVRRRLIDLAGKVVRHSGQLILKFTKAAYQRLDLRQLWSRANTPPQPATA